MYIINIILSVLVSDLVVFFTVKNLLKIKTTRKQFFIFSIILLPLLFITNLYFDGLIKLLFITIIEIISLYFSICEKDLVKSFYFAFITEILVFIFEIVLSILFVSVFNYNLQSYNSFSLSMLIFTILNGLSVYLISRVKAVQKLIISFYDTIKKKQYAFLYVIAIITLMILMIMFNKSNLKRDLSFYINAGMIVFVFMTLIYIFYKDLQNNKLENNYNEMMEYVSKYEAIINDQGKKNHEYNNQLMVIRGYINNPKKLEEYLDLIAEEHKCGQNYTIRQLSNFPDGGIKGLIYHKLSKMEENKIKYYLYIDKDSKNIFEEKFDIKTYQDITKLLGVFLDNAIEASLEADKKEIEIDIKNSDGSIIITISNTFNKNVDVKQVGKKGFTTKGVGHGYGLSIVKDISKHNKNIETFNDIDEDKFKQTIIIYYKK